MFIINYLKKKKQAIINHFYSFITLKKLLNKVELQQEQM